MVLAILGMLFIFGQNTTDPSNNSRAEKQYMYVSDNTDVSDWSQLKAAATSIRCLKD
jgi:hypothetical protein